MEAVFAPQPAVRRTWKHSFLEGWRWGKDTTDWFVQETSRLDLERPVLHVCSGSSKLGDVRVDAVHDAANLKADMFHLPFGDAAFPVVVCDPPYELNLQDRCKLAKELARVCRCGAKPFGNSATERTSPGPETPPTPVAAVESERGAA